MKPASRKSYWEEKLGRSGFFVGAVLFHLILFLLLATYVVYQAVPPEKTNNKFGAVSRNDLPPPTTPVKAPAPTDASVQPPSMPATASDKGPDSPVIPGSGPIIVPPVNPGDTGPAMGPPSQTLTLVKTSSSGIPGPRLVKIGGFEGTYRDRGDILKGDPRGKYPIYVASYADGDWYCNIQRDAQGNIAMGSLPNLAAKINQWTHGEVNAYVVPKPLNIGGPELLETKPPFIFFTGHKDFVLTDKEVANLQEYVEEGGAIWGDNALAGKGSRFDVAFKREMRRVVPDEGAKFEPVAEDAKVFTAQKYHISKVPQGMNYYAEQIEHLDIDGVPAIIYTPNDYSDLYAMRILEDDKTMMGDNIPLHWTGARLTTNGIFLHNRDLFFRNFTVDSSVAVHKLGLDMVTYLITRFDDQLLLITPP